MTANLPIDAEHGIWHELRAGIVPGRPAIFLDRDGILIHDRHYITDPDAVALMPGIVEVLRRARQWALPTVVVTNQSGIGRGYSTWDTYAAVHARMLRLLEAEGVGVDLVLACPHHPDGVGDLRHPDPPMRKPNPGMLTLAAARYGVALEPSLMLGDKIDDLVAAARAGLGTGFLVVPDLKPSDQVRFVELSRSLEAHHVRDPEAALPHLVSWAAERGRSRS